MSTLPISCRAGGTDFELFKKIVGRGIDSRLEAFTESRFEIIGGRLCMAFAESEIPILMRRLGEIADSEDELSEEAGSWEDDILNVVFGVEVS